jgi:hypothetical protein
MDGLRPGEPIRCLSTLAEALDHDVAPPGPIAVDSPKEPVVRADLHDEGGAGEIGLQGGMEAVP